MLRTSNKAKHDKENFSVHIFSNVIYFASTVFVRGNWCCFRIFFACIKENVFCARSFVITCSRSSKQEGEHNRHWAGQAASWSTVTRARRPVRVSSAGSLGRSSLSLGTGRRPPLQRQLRLRLQATTGWGGGAQMEAAMVDAAPRYAVVAAIFKKSSHDQFVVSLSFMARS
jgi:hypothetical protein